MMTLSIPSFSAKVEYRTLSGQFLDSSFTPRTSQRSGLIGALIFFVRSQARSASGVPFRAFWTPLRFASARAPMSLRAEGEAIGAWRFVAYYEHLR